MDKYADVALQCGNSLTVDEENIVVTRKSFSPVPIEFIKTADAFKDDEKVEFDVEVRSIY